MMKMSKLLLKRLLPMLLSVVLIVAMCGTFVAADEYYDEDEYFSEDSGDDYSEDYEEYDDSGDDEESEPEEEEPAEEPKYSVTIRLVASDDEDKDLSGHVEIKRSGDVIDDKDFSGGEATFNDLESGSYTAKVTSVDSDGYDCPDSKDFDIDDSDKTVTIKAPKSASAEPEPEEVSENSGSDNGSNDGDVEAQQQSQDNSENYAEPVEDNAQAGDVVEPENDSQNDDSNVVVNPGGEIVIEDNSSDDSENVIPADDPIADIIKIEENGGDVPENEEEVAPEEDTQEIIPENTTEEAPENTTEEAPENTTEDAELQGEDVTVPITASGLEESDESVEVSLVDANNEVVATATLDAGNSYASDFEFTLPDGTDLSAYGVTDPCDGTGLGDKYDVAIYGTAAEGFTLAFSEKQVEPDTRVVYVKAEIVPEVTATSVSGACLYDDISYPFTLEADQGWETTIEVPVGAMLDNGNGVQVDTIPGTELKGYEEQDDVITIHYDAPPVETKKVTVKAIFNEKPSVSSINATVKYSSGNFDVTLKKSEGWKTKIEVPKDASYIGGKADKVKNFQDPEIYETSDEKAIKISYIAKTENVSVKVKVYGGTKPTIKVGWSVKGTSMSGTVKLTANNGYFAYISEKIPKDKVKDVQFSYPQVDGYKRILDTDPVKYIWKEKLTRVSVKKRWVGPALKSLDVALICNGDVVDEVTLNAAGNWKDSFRGDFYLYDQYSGERNTYKVHESYKGNNIEEYHYYPEVTGNIYDGYVFTNTTTATVDFPVYKTWVCNKPMRYITVTLYANGKAIKKNVQITDRYDTGHNYWKYIFKNLPKYDSDGNQIKYEVKEAEIKGFEATYTTYNGGVIIKNTQVGATTSTTTISAKTGDDNPLFIYVLVLVCGAAVILFIGLKKRNDVK